MSIFNRRTFLSATAALAITAAIPKSPESPCISVPLSDWEIRQLREIGELIRRLNRDAERCLSRQVSEMIRQETSEEQTRELIGHA